MATHLEYLRGAMARAQFEQTESGAVWFTSIPAFDGLWAMGATRESARLELLETLDGWLAVHTKIGKSAAPAIDGMSLEAPPKLVQERSAMPDLDSCSPREFTRKLTALQYGGAYAAANRFYMVRTPAVTISGAQTATVPNIDLDVDLLTRVLRIAAIDRYHFIRC